MLLITMEFVSYNTVKRIDADLADWIITIAGDNRVPLPPVFEATSPLNEALDNFDCNEGSLEGTSSTCDTIRVLFQKCSHYLEKPLDKGKIFARPLDTRNGPQ